MERPSWAGERGCEPAARFPIRPAEETRPAHQHGGRTLRPAADGAPGRLGHRGGVRGRSQAGRDAGGAELGAAHDRLQLDAGDGGRVDAEILCPLVSILPAD